MRKNNIMKIVFLKKCIAMLFLCVACFTTTASADIKIKTKTDSGGETTTYIKGKRQRMELTGGTALITQCDLRRSVQLNQQTKTYTVSSFDRGETSATPVVADAERTQRAPEKRGGVVTSTITTRDTGERQQMFGFTARRIKSSTVTEPSPDACLKDKSRIDSDGWYIDLPIQFNCEQESSTAVMAATNNGGGCQDQYRTRQVGTAKLGYPVKVTMSFYDENNQPTTSYAYEVVELSKATLDAALFDVPADYREVKNAQEMYAAMASAAGADEAMSNGSSSVINKNVQNLANGQPVTAATLGAKKAGTVRVGVAMTKTTSVGEGLSATTLSEAVRNTMINSLNAPAIEVVALDARLPAQIDAEAKQKECDYVVYTTATHKKGKSGGFGGFLKAAAPVASLGGYGSTAGAVAAMLRRRQFTLPPMSPVPSKPKMN